MAIPSPNHVTTYTTSHSNILQSINIYTQKMPLRAIKLLEAFLIFKRSLLQSHFLSNFRRDSIFMNDIVHRFSIEERF